MAAVHHYPQPGSGFDGATVAGGIGMTVAAVIFGVLRLARKVSMDKVGFIEDRAREDVIHSLKAMLEKERAEKEKAHADAREAWNTRTADAAKIAELTVTIKFLTETNGKLVEDVNKLRNDVHTLRNELAKKELAKGGA